MTTPVDLAQTALHLQHLKLSRLSNHAAKWALIELAARYLYYQDRGEPDWRTTPYEDLLRKEFDKLPQVIVDRYRNEPTFHMQVDRFVNGVLEILNRVDPRESL